MNNTVFATCQCLMHRKSIYYYFKIQFILFKYNIIFQKKKKLYCEKSEIKKIRQVVMLRCGQETCQFFILTHYYFLSVDVNDWQI